mgnify:CR=1 FL=1
MEKIISEKNLELNKIVDKYHSYLKNLKNSDNSLIQLLKLSDDISNYGKELISYLTEDLISKINISQNDYLDKKQIPADFIISSNKF